MTAASSRERLPRARRLIAVQALVGVLAGVVVAGLTTLVVVVWGQRQATDRALDDLVSSRSTAEVPPGSWVVVLGPDGRRVTAGDVPADLPTSRQRASASTAGPAGVSSEVYVGKSEYLTRAVLDGGSTVIAGVDVSAQEDERNRLLAGLVGASLLAGAFAAWLGRRLARRAVGAWDEALERQERFVADASHELRTPLSRLALRARLIGDGLRDGTPSKDLADDARLLSEEAAVMGELVDDLLHAATLGNRPDTGELVDVAAVARDVVEREQVRATQRGLLLTVRVAPVEPVRGVEAALQRALDALVDNALRHAGHEVDVVVEPVAPAGVRVDVADDGPGIPPDEALHVFDRFSRGADDGRGFGLGLALVRDVVHHHGGSVAVHHLARGTRFTVILPAEPVTT